MKPKNKKYIKLRTLIIGFIFSAFFIAIGTKAVHLQLFCGSWLSQKAADEYETSFKSSGNRGKIYDRNLQEMAVSMEGTSIAAYPAHIPDKQSAGISLAKVLDTDNKTLSQKLMSKKSFVWIKRQVTPSKEKAVRELKIRGVGFISENVRLYPNKTLAAQLIGFSGIDGNGLEGVEYHYNTYLKADTGTFTILKDCRLFLRDSRCRFFRQSQSPVGCCTTIRPPLFL
ncbi:hypothetical protein ACFL9U_18160 [Thermodesulfobacteriota bacterium]